MLVSFSIFIILSVNIVSVLSDCGVVSKKDWDGLDPVQAEYLARPVDLVIIQHTATQTCNTDSACKNIVRGIQDYHMDQLKYWDISASFLVGGNGKIYEGTGWLHVGAHTYGFNRKSIGITFIGNFNEDQPTPEALDAVKNLLKCGVENGHIKEKYNLVGHKQLIPTESPGRKLYAEIRRWPNYVSDTDSLTKQKKQ